MSKTLRINFELDQADNPPLYDELMRFTKGAKRANRLRTLAYAGLMIQAEVCLAKASTDLEPQAMSVDPTHAAATLELFGPAL
ncbi:hypothetical protein [Pseudoduganella lutea]|uniref:Uncharacterized protein n=1 Tax=Pseudoduganella lutea TaxID=321985 RepID=A0A4P6L4B7_9BURK|nr:hypothetical protein [Pseudoduganella lutea]QBE66307.1 hypothetical protein EWM63_27770 [Pseudoduganella lutea]